MSDVRVPRNPVLDSCFVLNMYFIEVGDANGCDVRCVAVKTLPLNTDVEIECIAVL